MEESQKLIFGYPGALGAFKDILGEAALDVVELDDPLFHGIVGNQTVDGHGLGLAVTVGAVGGLVLKCRVPPGLENDHVVRGGQVYPDPARFQC